MTDNFVAGSRQNYLVNGSGTRLAAANPADPLANLSLSFLGDPVYADGRAAATSDYLDAANTYYQQDAQRMRAAGYGDRIYGRVVTVGRQDVAAVLAVLLLQPAERARLRRARGRLGVRPGRARRRRRPRRRHLRPARRRRALRVEPRPADDRRRAGRLRRARVARLLLLLGRQPARAATPTTTTAAAATRCARRSRSSRQSTPFMAWRGKWGASSSSPVAPRRQGKWGDPNGFDAAAGACTVGARSARRRRARSDSAPTSPRRRSPRRGTARAPSCATASPASARGA